MAPLRSLCLALLVATAACTADDLHDPPASAAHGHPKPQAPVAVSLETRQVAPGAWDVTLVATPERDVDAIELRVADRTIGLGPTRAGQTRRLSARVTQPGDVAGGAMVVQNGRRQSRAAVATLGGARAALPAPPTRRVELPGGIGVAEVRP